MADDFTPRCLSCRYELVGLPDGLCPECGIAFTHADLLRRHQQRKWQAPAFSPRWLLVFIWSVTLAFWHSGGLLGEFLLQVIIWLTMGWWASGRRRLDEHVPREPVALLALASAVRLVLAATGLTPPPLPIFLAGVVLAAVLYALPPERPSWPAVALPGALSAALLAFGFAMFLDNLRDFQAGHHWSAWGELQDDPFGSPLSVSAGMWFGAGAFGAGLLAAGVAWRWALLARAAGRAATGRVDLATPALLKRRR